MGHQKYVGKIQSFFFIGPLYVMKYGNVSNQQWSLNDAIHKCDEIGLFVQDVPAVTDLVANTNPLWLLITFGISIMLLKLFKGNVYD